MKKVYRFLSIMVVMIFSGTTTVTWAGERKIQQTFTLPDGSTVTNGISYVRHLWGQDINQRFTAVTPPPGLVVTRTDESFEKTTTAPYHENSPCNNYLGHLTTKVRESRKTTTLKQPETSVVGVGGGENPALLNVTLPAVFNGAAAAAVGGTFYYLGQKARRPTQIGVTQNGGGATAYGGDAKAIANADARAHSNSNAEINHSANNYERSRGGGHHDHHSDNDCP